jgi:hypothetical protein
VNIGDLAHIPLGTGLRTLGNPYTFVKVGSPRVALFHGDIGEGWAIVHYGAIEPAVISMDNIKYVVNRGDIYPMEDPNGY